MDRWMSHIATRSDRSVTFAWSLVVLFNFMRSGDVIIWLVCVRLILCILMDFWSRSTLRNIYRKLEISDVPWGRLMPDYEFSQFDDVDITLSFYIMWRIKSLFRILKCLVINDLIIFVNFIKTIAHTTLFWVINNVMFTMLLLNNCR